MAVHGMHDDLKHKKALFGGIVYRKSEYKIVVSVDSEDSIPSDAEGCERLFCLLVEVNDVTYKRFQNVLKDLESLS